MTLQPPVLDSIDEILYEFHPNAPDWLKEKLLDLCNKQVVLGRIDENEAWLKLAQTTDADAVHLKSLIKQLEDHIKVLKAAQPHKGKDK